MPLLDFVIIGAQKSGTTTLASVLSAHPQVAFCLEKEPHFFSVVEDWRDEISRYHGLFPQEKDGRIFGEASTSYSFYPVYPHTARRIHEYNPCIKLIYLLRDPIERVHSHFAHRVVRNKISGATWNEVFDNPGYINNSRYYLQLSQYRHFFPEDQILVLTFEELITNPIRILNLIGNFLNIDTNFFSQYSRLPILNKSFHEGHVTVQGRFLSAQWPFKVLPYRIKRFVVRRFFTKSVDRKVEFPANINEVIFNVLAQDVENLERYLGRELSEWRLFKSIGARYHR